nr:hypothetical protein [Kibdelosporangium sp. MJ126-NF4]CTQ89387.1 hypothetical protein [Kibdelosporangium sp. MJ126-NF4]
MPRSLAVNGSSGGWEIQSTIGATDSATGLANALASSLTTGPCGPLRVKPGWYIT